MWLPLTLAAPFSTKIVSLVTGVFIAALSVSVSKAANPSIHFRLLWTLYVLYCFELCTFQRILHTHFYKKHCTGNFVKASLRSEIFLMFLENGFSSKITIFKWLFIFGKSKCLKFQKMGCPIKLTKKWGKQVAKKLFENI